MKQPQSQDHLDTFKKSLEHNIIDWETFFHLDMGQRADAEQILEKQNIISTNQEGNYKVSPGIRGIVPASRAPAHFTNEIIANTLVDFYKERNIQVSITEL